MGKQHGEGYKYHSVTQILGERRKLGLEFWYLYNTPEFCKAESKKGREAGTGIHELIEKTILGQPIEVDTDYAEEVETGYKSYLKFKKENPQYIFDKTEVQIDVDKYKYSGKIDCIGKDKKDLTIFDWKGGKVKKGELTIHKSMKEQLAMYVVGYELVFNVKVKRAIVVLLARNEIDYKTEIMERDEIQAIFDNVCVGAIKAYNYYHGRKK